MPYINHGNHRSHLHKVKRLNHNHHATIKNLPPQMLNENSLEKTTNYIKFFDYPLPQLLTNHSTNPLQNTTRQYVDIPTKISNEGRFVNHEMIIRRNGETTFLRPKRDPVLANGFTPVIRPSSLLPSYQSIMSHSQVSSSSSSSSLSIMNKMSEKKQSEQTSIIKTKRKNRRRAKRCNEKFFESHNYNFPNEFHQQSPQNSNVIHFFKQTLHEMIVNENNFAPQPVPLMSIQPVFHSPPSNHFNEPFRPQFEESCFHQDTFQPRNFNDFHFLPRVNSLANNRYQESSYDLSSQPYHQFHMNNIPQDEHICKNSYRSPPRNYIPTTDYFFY
ncbi:hypothetical protein I4U23_030455 [Adineta vaga]|nr:hypothetical protein I4U23_030455 [Adineta vaga]